MNPEVPATIEEVYPRYSHHLLTALAQDYHDQLDGFLARTNRHGWRLGEMFLHERPALEFGPEDVVVSCSLFFKSANFARRECHPQRDESGQILPSEIYKKPHPVFAGTPREPKSFFECYVKPLLEGAWSSCKVVVFLASDLLCLQGILQGSGIHVVVMRHAGIAHNPGAMWRYLALNFPCRAIYFADTDRKVEKRRVHCLLDILDAHPHISLVRPLQNTGGLGQLALILGNDFLVRASHVDFDAAKSMLGYLVLNILTEDRPASFVHENRHDRPYFTPRLDEPGYVGSRPTERVPRKCFPYYGFDEQWLKETVYYHFSNGRMATLMHNRRPDDHLQNLDVKHQEARGNLLLPGA